MARSWIAATSWLLRIRPVPLIPSDWASRCNSGSSIDASPVPARRRCLAGAPETWGGVSPLLEAPVGVPSGASAGPVRSSVVSLTSVLPRNGFRSLVRPADPVSAVRPAGPAAFCRTSDVEAVLSHGGIRRRVRQYSVRSYNRRIRAWPDDRGGLLGQVARTWTTDRAVSVSGWPRERHDVLVFVRWATPRLDDPAGRAMSG